ncbi:MAG: PEP-CTERM system histidine kinase PrsK [Burkholderiales bacterium]|nr:PEP-CTERM system histidine kinase PrsK [Burkholderiales bacterium]
MSLLAWLAGGAYLLLALWLLPRAMGRSPDSLRRVWAAFTVASLLSAAWAVQWGGLRQFEEVGAATLLLDGLRQLAWLASLFLLLGLEQSDSHRRVLRWLVPVVALLALLLMLGGEARWFPRRWTALAAPYAGLGLSVLGLVLLEQLYRSTPEDNRWNVKPLCLGLAAMYGFDLYLFAESVLLSGEDAQAVALRPVVHALGLPLLFVAGVRGRGMPSRFGLSRDAAFHSAALLLAGSYLLLVAALGYWLRYTGGEWGLALQLLLAVGAALSLAVILMSASMRARLRVWLSKHFLRYRYDYRQEWLRFTAAMTDRAGEGDPARSVLRALAHLVESPGGALWRSGSDGHVQVAHWNYDRFSWREPEDSAFARLLAEKSWIVDLNAERRSPSGVVPVPQVLLDDRDAWLVVPLVTGGALQGWVVLAQPRTPFPLNWEVLDLLRSAASQASGYLAMHRATEQLLEARKFEAFNRMSAFVVHDLKNIVTQLSLMMRNAERHGDNPEFRRDMMDTVENALEKMRQLMTQLREGDRPASGASGVPLQVIAQRLQAEAAQRGRRLELQIEQPLSTRGHEARVERVIGHAVQNAFDASDETQAVELLLERFGSYAKLQVRDQGCGMSAEFIRERLFKPFQTTKQQGMGIGAYESLQYVQELGGKMEVQSEPGQGSAVTFLLPLFHIHTETSVPHE